MCQCDPTIVNKIAQLKLEADRNWVADARRSVAIGDEIIQIATEQQCVWHLALGTMVRGDGLKYGEALEEAWETLDRAGALFLDAGDEVGWGRTRIGKLWICDNLLRVEEMLADVPRAAAIFEHNHAYVYGFRLRLNLGVLYHRLDDLHRALEIYFSALEIAKNLDPAEGDQIGVAYFNIAAVYITQGDTDLADQYYRLAKEPLTRFSSNELDVLFLLHTGFAALQGGFIQNALICLQKSLHLSQQRQPDAYTDILRMLAQCYLDLNRFEDALELLLQVIAQKEQSHAYQDQTIALRLLVKAYLGLAQQDELLASTYLDEAARAIGKAERHYLALQGAEAGLAAVQLLKARIDLKAARFASSIAASEQAESIYAQSGWTMEEMSARLLTIRALLEFSMDLPTAAAKAVSIIAFARPRHLEALRYSAHLTLGRIRERQGRVCSAIRHYQAATLIAKLLQSNMTITLRPYFLEDKDAALRELIRLHLNADNASVAFETLEQFRSQVFLSYLNNRDRLRWRLDDAESQRLAAELRELRADYHRLKMPLSIYAETQDAPQAVDENAVNSRAEMLERNIRMITEQLYLRAAEDQSAVYDTVPDVHEAEVRSKLHVRDIVVEYFGDGKDFWAITLDKNSTAVTKLPATYSTVTKILEKLSAALEFVRPLTALDPFAEAMSHTARVIMTELHKLLIKPLLPRLEAHERIYFVPFGSLHVVPFNALYSGTEYLIECYEIVTLPSIGLLLHQARPHPDMTAGVTVVAYESSHTQDALPGVVDEATYVHDLFGGDLYTGESATREALSRAAHSQPRQVLHIAAHGLYDLNRPELSHIRLADGRLQTDDLLQMDIPYELVVLSGCQTGLARTSGGDELIGLGRGFFYAGASALVTTLWSINDEIAVLIMQHFYRGLREGLSKPAALRAAQLEILRTQPTTHLAFWAAYQIIGNPDPLSFVSSPHPN